ncbi:Zinc finger MYM-type protein 1 [Holothuria leucospilota]|uniref:Zinc finger MYM-type protein 1 n=1 Tax=Holothuria leucospilota TaxID=206669 RepID=A0A9Q1HGM8_HOLLE|nr:Zinc finger MYM-type protein 1 [Holothuria leucospilota]
MRPKRKTLEVKYSVDEPHNTDDTPSSSSALPEDPNEPSSLKLKPIAESDKESSKDSRVDGRDHVHSPSSASRFLEDGPFQPDCTFPVSNGRKFRKEWFSIFKWLEYSPALDKAFCFPCHVFPGNGCMEEAFTRKQGFKNWKKGIKRFTKHQNSLAHCAAIEQMIAFKSSQQNGSVAANLIQPMRRESTF